MSKIRDRTPRPVRRMGTTVMSDSRTQRERTRGDALRAAIERELGALRNLKEEPR
jgi:hypothetical protein